MRKAIVLLVCILGLSLSSTWSENSQNASSRPRVTIGWDKLKKIPGNKSIFAFSQITADPNMKNLNLPGSVGKYGSDNVCGKIVRVMRYKNITRAVELRYNLPKNILLSMMMEESTGMDLFGNALNDGGFGLIHMQPKLADNFGLKTYKECGKLRCKMHHLELKKIIEDNNFDRKKVVKYDDRLQPVLNIDAAGRMLAYYLSMDAIKDLGPIRSAIRRYAGRWNYRSYFKDIVRNMAYLDDKETMKKVEACFNKLNSNLLINGKPANFDRYIEVCQVQNNNYGLAAYKKMSLLKIPNADGGNSVYAKYVNPQKPKIKNACGC